MTKGFCIVLLVTLFASFSVAGVVTQDYSFERPVVTAVEDGQWITMNGCRIGGIPGAPALPSYGVRLLLPPGEGVASVRIVAGERHLLGTGFVIPPNQYEVPYSSTGPYEKMAPNPDIYATNRPYPYQDYSTPINQGYCGHTLGFLTINPVSYNPVTGEVWWYSQMHVEVITAPEANAASRLQTLYYRNDRIQRDLERWVDNPEEIGMYPPVQQTRQEEYDMVIITNAAMQPTFQTYADLKTRRGIRTFVQTTEWIYANVAGSDNAAKIRNYIITCYTTYHIQYVLLGGDGDASGAGNVIPHRGVYAASHYGGGDETDTDLPCDLYYGGLDGTWNTDGDGQYGEETPEEADFIAEVHVGRACVDNVTEATRFINKHTLYQRAPIAADCGGRGVLFAGELLWDDGGGWTFGDTYMEEVRWGSSAHGYTTHGVDEPALADTLYDRPFYPNSWSALTHLKPKLNNGCSFLHHLGHANETYACRFNSSDVTDANMTNNGTNHNFYLVYSQGCYCGSFEYNDCIAEHWTCEINNGAVAIIMNSRYGWGYHSSTRGSSQYFHREFGDAIYGEHLTHLAAANDDSKMDCLPWIDNDDMANRWCALELNVFGDPELDIWTHVPQVLSPVYDPVYLIGTGSFTVNVPGVGGALVACNFGGQLVGRGYTDASGHVIITLNPAPVEPGTMEVVITAHNYLEYSGSVSVIPPAGPYVIYDSYSTTEAVGIANGQVDAGEQLLLTLQVKNVGVETAVSATVTIATADPYITITDHAEFYGDILPSGLKSVPNGFAFTVAPNTPDGHFVVFSVHVEEVGTRDSWDSNFSLEVHAPIVQFTSLTIDDGTGDSHLNPGETGTLALTVTNDGSCLAQNLTITMMTDNPYLQVTNGSGIIASLAPTASGSPSPAYTVYVLPGCPDLNLAYLYFNIAGDLGYENAFVQELTLNPFWENVESGQGGWTHEAASSWTDQWHISTETSWSPTHAWKCGDTGTGTYANHDDARLITPTINLPAGTQLRFKQQMNGETSSVYPDSAYDGGIVEISVNGGAWTQLASPQYNKHFRYTSGGGSPATHPFPGGIPCFSGDIAWSQATCDLSAYSGNVQIRFRFGSDNGTGKEGWYVDDIEIVRVSTLLPPTNLQANITAGVVTLTWNSPGSSRDLLGYNLYRNNQKIGSMITELSTTDDLDGQPYGTYTYKVTAVYSAGESSSSNTASVEYRAEPNPVVDLTAAVSGTDVILRWTATTGAESYEIYRVADPFAAPTPSDLLGTTASTTYTDTGASATMEIAFYIVVAVNSN